MNNRIANPFLELRTLLFTVWCDCIESLSHAILLPHSGSFNLCVVPHRFLLGYERTQFQRFWSEVTEVEVLTKQDGNPYCLRIWWFNTVAVFGINRDGSLSYDGFEPFAKLVESLKPFALRDDMTIDPLQVRIAYWV